MHLTDLDSFSHVASRDPDCIGITVLLYLCVYLYFPQVRQPICIICCLRLQEKACISMAREIYL